MTLQNVYAHRSYAHKPKDGKRTEVWHVWDGPYGPGRRLTVVEITYDMRWFMFEGSGADLTAMAVAKAEEKICPAH